MKFRVLIFAVIAIAAGVVAWIGFNNGFNKNQMANAYIPRSEFQTTYGIKGAFEYYRSIKSNIYTGQMESEDFLRVKSAIKTMEKSTFGMAKNADVTWSSMGPDNVGGRTRAILPFPNDVNTLIAGGVSGGLFKTTDAGQEWNKITTFEDNLIVSSIAMLGNGAIYVGTGHSREHIFGNGSSGFMGGGLFVSVDNGDTWNLVSDFEPALLDPNSDWTYINKIVADGSNPDRLWIANNFGLFPYIHGSSELGASAPGVASGAIKDLAISKDGQNIITATGSRIYVSTDFGASFVRINDQGSFLSLNASGFANVDFDIAPDDKNFMVASMPTQGSGTLLGIFASRDAGQTWHTIAPSSNGGTSTTFAPFTQAGGSGSQGNYDNMITIAPGTNAAGDVEIIMGGIKLYKYKLPPSTTPGIFQWEGINETYTTSPGQAPSPYYVHPDIHTAAWDAEGRLYIGCDGGIFRSSDRGNTWVSLNNNYITTQFYNIAFSPTGEVLGGTQDNGTLWLRLTSPTGKGAIEHTGGDGFSCEISQLLPDFMFSTYTEGTVYRSATGGGNITNVGNLDSLSNGGGTDFSTDIAFHENINNEFSESYINYMPTLNDPYLNLFPQGEYELTANGDTIIGKVNAGTTIIVSGKDSEIQASKVLTEDLNFYSFYKRTVDTLDFIYHNIGDTTQIKERAQFMLAAALSNGVYITRQPLKVNGLPSWVKIGINESSFPSSIEFSPDGDHLYVGYIGGNLIRYSGFNSAWKLAEMRYNHPNWALTKTTIYSGSGAIMDIEVDNSQGQGTSGDGPASGKVVISIGNYGGSGKVRVSNTANTATGADTFESIWNVDASIQGMPCYSVVMDVNNPDIIMAGTEFGVYYTDNNGDSWTPVNNGDMVKVPVYDLRQQKQPKWNVINSGVVYAGSHGSGIYKTDYLLNPATAIEKYEAALPTLSKLKIYPNPVASNGTIQFDLGVSEKVSMSIYSLDGKLIKTSSPQTMESGKKKEIRFDAADLSSGIYIVQVKVGNTIQTGKFIKTQGL